MAKTVNILVACGSGVATSMLVASIIKERLNKTGISYTIEGTNVNSLPYRITGHDLIVCSAQVPFEVSLPVFNSLPILTGVGKEELLDKIVNKVKEISEKG